MGNHSGDYKVAPATEMRAFDALPLVLRTALNYARGCYSAVECFMAVREGMPAPDVRKAISEKDAIKHPRR